MATWNVGMADADAFSSEPDAHESVVRHMMTLLDHVHVVGIHALHPRHHEPVAAAFGKIDHSGFAAAACGDAVIWCHRGKHALARWFLVHRWFLEG